MTKEHRDKKYYQSARGRAMRSYYFMVHKCQNPHSVAFSHVEVNMTRDEWLAWAVPRYVKWDREHPGVSVMPARKGDRGNFRIGNIELVSAEEGRLRTLRYFKAKDGMKICTKCFRKASVVAFCKQVREFDGLSPRCRTCAGADQKIKQARYVEHRKQYRLLKKVDSGQPGTT